MLHFVNRLCRSRIHALRSVPLLARSTNVILAVLLFAGAAAFHGRAQQPGRPSTGAQASEEIAELPDAPLASTQTTALSSSATLGSHPSLQPLSPNQKFAFATKNAFERFCRDKDV
jgi:hypothetical protein